MDVNEAIFNLEYMWTRYNEEAWEDNDEMQGQIAGDFANLFHGLPLSIQTRIMDQLQPTRVALSKMAPATITPTIAPARASHAPSGGVPPRGHPCGTPTSSFILAPFSYEIFLYLQENQDRWISSPAEFFNERTFHLLGAQNWDQFSDEEIEVVKPLAFRFIARALFQCRNTWPARRRGDFRRILNQQTSMLNSLVVADYHKWLSSGRTFAVISERCVEGTLIVLPLSWADSRYMKLPECQGLIKFQLQSLGTQTLAKYFVELERALGNYIFEALGSLKKPGTRGPPPSTGLQPSESNKRNIGMPLPNPDGNPPREHVPFFGDDVAHHSCAQMVGHLAVGVGTDMDVMQPSHQSYASPPASETNSYATCHTPPLGQVMASRPLSSNGGGSPENHAWGDRLRSDQSPPTTISAVNEALRTQPWANWDVGFTQVQRRHTAETRQVHISFEHRHEWDEPGAQSFEINVSELRPVDVQGHESYVHDV